MIGTKQWHKDPITDKQVGYINRLLENVTLSRKDIYTELGWDFSNRRDIESLNKLEAHDLIELLQMHQHPRNIRWITGGPDDDGDYMNDDDDWLWE